MTVTLNGYAIGDTVEVRDTTYHGDNNIPVDQWTTATINKLDPRDAELPYQVVFPGDTDDYWVRADNIRKVQAPAKRLEYRRIGQYGAVSAWFPLPLGEQIRMSAAERFEIREVPARTDAEIIAKLREHVSSNAGNLSAEGKRLLRGEF